MDPVESLPILVVDNKPQNLYSFRHVLEGGGFSVVTAESGMEALRYLLKRDVSLILLDVQMPEMNGFEVAQAVQRNPRHRQVPILFITASHRTDDFINHGYDVGAYDYLAKPVDDRILLNKVRLFHTLYLQQQALLAEREARKKAESREHYLAFQSGVFDMSNTMMHHIGNSIQGMEASIALLNESHTALSRLHHFYQKSVAELAEAEQQDDHPTIDRLHKMLLDASLKMPAVLESELLSPMGESLDSLQQGVRHVVKIIRVQQRGSNPRMEQHCFSVKDLLDDLAVIVGERLQRDEIEWHQWVDPELGEICLPRNQLLQSLVALTQNGIDAIEQQLLQGELKQAEGRIAVRVSREGERLRIELEDNGEGISEAVRARLFSFGFTTRTNGQGVGLHNAGNFISSCQGTIELLSEGVGARVVASLPLPLGE